MSKELTSGRMWGFASHSKVEKLQERIETLEHDFKALELDWINVYAKLRKAVGRIVKSEATIASKDAVLIHTSSGSVAAGADNGAASAVALAAPDTPNGSLLTDHQRQIQQDILRKRARM